MKISISNILSIGLSFFCFWYIYYSYNRGHIGLRASKFYLDSNPGMFWLVAIFVASFAIYLLYLVFSGKGEEVS